MAQPGSVGFGIFFYIRIFLILMVIGVVVFFIVYSKKHPRIEGDSSSTSIGYGILSFFVPLVGLILFLVWKETAPGNSKVSGIGALVGLIFWSIVIPIFWFFVIAALIHG